jgi:hypothetical protein
VKHYLEPQRDETFVQSLIDEGTVCSLAETRGRHPGGRGTGIDAAFSLGVHVVGGAPIPTWWGMVIATMSLVQLASGVIIDRHYDKELWRYYPAAVFYPSKAVHPKRDHQGQGRMSSLRKRSSSRHLRLMPGPICPDYSCLRYLETGIGADIS